MDIELLGASTIHESLSDERRMDIRHTRCDTDISAISCCLILQSDDSERMILTRDISIDHDIISFDDDRTLGIEIMIKYIILTSSIGIVRTRKISTIPREECDIFSYGIE